MQTCLPATMSRARLAQRLLRPSTGRSVSAAQHAEPAQHTASPCTVFFRGMCSVIDGEQSRQKPARILERVHTSQYLHPGTRDLSARCTAGAEAEAGGLRSLHQPMQQQYGFAALAEPWLDDAAESNQPLRERQQLVQQQQQAAAADLHHQHRPRLPSLEDVRDRLRSGGGASCSSAGSPSQQVQRSKQAQPPTTDDGTLNWRSLVAAIRNGDQALPRPGEVLTDTFR